MNKVISIGFFLFLFQLSLFSQDKLNLNDNKGTMLELGFEYNFLIPQADMKQYFADYKGVGMHFQLLSKRNIYFGGQMQFLFGNELDQDPLVQWRDNLENVYGLNYTFAINPTKMRGLSGQIYTGKLFPIKAKNARMGIKTTLGVGFLQHKLKIQKDPTVFLPQLEGDYMKILDNMHNGISLHQFIGFHYLGNNRMINWYAGVECLQAFTENRRSYSYDIGIDPIADRMDMSIGFKIGWILPFYINETSDNIWY